MIALVLKLGGHKYEIIKVNFDDDDDDESEILGQFEPIIRTIYISSKIKNNKIFAETIFHEAIHAIFYDMGATQLMLNEIIVHSLTNRLLDVLRNNPWLRKALFEEGEKGAEKELQAQPMGKTSGKGKEKEKSENESEEQILDT
jgi:hypothetical protein